MSTSSFALSLDPSALLARRVLPLALAIYLWCVLISAARLMALAF